MVITRQSTTRLVCDNCMGLYVALECVGESVLVYAQLLTWMLENVFEYCYSNTPIISEVKKIDNYLCFVDNGVELFLMLK